MLLGDDLAVDLVLLALLFFEFLVAPGLELGKAAREGSRAAAIEPDRARATDFAGTVDHG